MSVGVLVRVTCHWSKGSLVQRVTGPNPNVVLDLRNKEILNSCSYVYTVRPFRNSDFRLVILWTSELLPLVMVLVFKE